MNRILFGILMCTLISIGALQGQSRKNPFELLHRKGNKPEPATVAADTSGTDQKVISPDSVTPPSIPVDTIIPDTRLEVEGIPEPATQQGSIENQTPSQTTDQPGNAGLIDSVQNQETEENTGSGNVGNDRDSSLTQNNIFKSDDTLTIEEIIPVVPAEKIVKRKKMGGAFLALIFLGVLLLLTIIVNINRKLLHQIYRASLNENYSALLYRERKHSAFNYLYSIAYVIFFINAGLFIYQAQFLDIWFHPETYALWVFILFPVVIYTIRHLVMRLLATVFPISKEINQFNFNIVVFNIMIGLFLIPVNLFIAFGPTVLHVPIVYTSIVAIGIFYIFRQLRGVLIATPLLQNSLFLFFIYLCTVEILPLAVIFKLLS